MNYVQRLKEHLKNKHLIQFCLDLAKANNIELYIHEDYHERFFSGTGIIGCSLGPNKINASTTIHPNLLLHELCHLLVVEPEYRHMMFYDTQASYKSIALKQGVSAYRTEGTTFALQHLIMEKIGVPGGIASSFYTGQLGNKHHKLKDRWIENARDVLASITMVEYKKPSEARANYLNNGYYVKSVFEVPKRGSEVIIARVAKEHEFDTVFDESIYKNDSFYIGNQKLSHSDVYAWTYRK